MFVQSHSELNTEKDTEVIMLLLAHCQPICRIFINTLISRCPVQTQNPISRAFLVNTAHSQITANLKPVKEKSIFLFEKFSHATTYYKCTLG